MRNPLKTTKVTIIALRMERVKDSYQSFPRVFCTKESWFTYQCDCDNSRSLAGCTSAERRILRYIFNVKRVYCRERKGGGRRRRWEGRRRKEKEEERLESEHGTAQYSEIRVQRAPIVVPWYFHPLLFFTIIASDMENAGFVTGKRDSPCARAQSDGRARFSLPVSLFPQRSSLRVRAAGFN